MNLEMDFCLWHVVWRVSRGGWHDVGKGCWLALQCTTVVSFIFVKSFSFELSYNQNIL